MNRESHDEKADGLFPAPSPPPTVLCPQRLPGCGIESLKALRHVLIDNHTRHHIYFNNTKFHNHITHRALAIYAMGGSGPVIEAFYKQDSEMQRPAFASPKLITEQNFVEHLGDEHFYEAYTSFFDKVIEEKGAAATFEEFVFSEKYNFDPRRDAASQPEMLSRFVDGVMHPLIHCGYGVEFGLKGMLSEGLAMTALQDAHARKFLPPSLFVAQVASGVDETEAKFASLVLDDTSMTPNRSAIGQGTHAFSILARVLKDPGLAPNGPRQFVAQYPDTLTAHEDKIRAHVDNWTIDLSIPGEIERKVEECIWTASVMYAVGGWNEEGFTADFFLMHLVTSSIFIPSLITSLSPRAQVLFLRVYFASAVASWISRGRPCLNFKRFFESTSPMPNPPNNLAPPVDSVLTQDAQPPNPFLPLIQSSIMHPNDHHLKIQRAFAHFSAVYGTRPRGYFSGTELDGAEELDGSLFLRAAVLTADYMGWVEKGEEAKNWSFNGFFSM
ncbi:hypothetical protein DEU56DRAFT_480362 [Suillus clintonianus]|uniref:uncharacterized protein n=1 Tax=Suillus clintonianus TaxID=1904413 RepID=UPI001B871589|nr:uncharacterized protein DEU56DRAFT_480362 [Suillus clintonianus]KAG2153340.1 hypothetical protein DEU56DRAFT_480362 [Suillus clintonianus]